MPLNYSIIENKLVIKRPSFLKNIGYKLIYLIPFFISFSLDLFFDSLTILFDVLVILVTFYALFVADLFLPSILRDIVISKSEHSIYINGKELLLKDVLFLSFREADHFKYIKLESKRTNILSKNEILLNNECESFDEALHLCRVMRDFIDPDLLINYISIGWGITDSPLFSNLTGTEATRHDGLEIWNYIK